MASVFPVPAEVLTVELSNFRRSRINGSGFELVFELFDRITQERIKVYSIGYQKGELEALLCELDETKCECMLFFP